MNVTGTLIVLILALSACSPQTTVNPPATNTPHPTNTNARVFTSTPVNTLMAETPTVVPTSTLATSPTPFGGSGKIAFVSCDYETVNDNGLVFERTDVDSCEIHTMNADGRDPINLTNNAVWDGDPAPSPDGTKIAYVSERGNNAEIYVMNTDGSGKIQLTDNQDWDREPAWSPDGTQLVFVSELRRQRIYEIKIMSAEGSGQTVLAKFSMSSDGNVLSPAWSPRGTQIVFVREGFDQANCQGCSEIFVMDADGGNLTQLTHNNGWSQNPAWSPDGAKIAYETYLKPRDIAIAVINSDGSGQSELANTEGWDSQPSWSPDGKAIAFQSDEEQPNISEFDIYVISADGSHPQKLTHNRNSGSPAWLPPPLNPLVQKHDCSAGWSRLKAGDQAKVSEETKIPNRVRSGPSTGEEITSQLEPGTIVRLLEGPACAEGLIFWKVENESITGGAGWTAEGDGASYWLEPYMP